MNTASCFLSATAIIRYYNSFSSANFLSLFGKIIIICLIAAIAITMACVLIFFSGDNAKNEDQPFDPNNTNTKSERLTPAPLIFLYRQNADVHRCCLTSFVRQHLLSAVRQSKMAPKIKITQCSICSIELFCLSLHTLNGFRAGGDDADRFTATCRDAL